MPRNYFKEAAFCCRAVEGVGNRFLMIGVDTNVLIRYIVRDDRPQAEAATKLIESGCTSDDPGFVNRIVFFLCLCRPSISVGAGLCHVSQLCP
jgi:hypothetical protein